MNHEKMRVSGRLALGLILALSYTGASQAQTDAAKLYKAKCAVCHGAEGKGDAPAGKKLGARDLNSPEVQNQSDAELIEIVTKGKNKMPAYGKTLKDDQIKGLVAYIRELAKKK